MLTTTYVQPANLKPMYELVDKLIGGLEAFSSGHCKELQLPHRAAELESH